MQKNNIEEKEDTRGRPITCRFCGNKFTMNGDEKRKKWRLKEYPCPDCKTLYCFMTETEKQLQIIQAQYRENNNDIKYLKEMHKILLGYAENIIKKYYINKIEDKSLLPLYAKSAVSLLIESDFVKKKDFYIDTSFGKRLKQKCIQAIDGDKESYERGLQDDSLDYEFEKDGHSITYEDKSKSVIDSIEQEEEKLFLCKRICSLLFEMENYCESPYENYIRLLNVYNYLEGGEIAIDRFFELYGRYGKMKTIESLNIVKEELKEILSLDRNNTIYSGKDKKVNRYYVNNPMPSYNSFRIFDKENPNCIISKKEWNLFYNTNAKQEALKECYRMNKENKQ
jgi:hypothetical protein